MSAIHFVLGSLLLVSPGIPAGQDSDRAQLHRQLAEAVDLPNARARRSAARELAKQEDVPLQAWLEACATFTPRTGGLPEGVSAHTVELQFAQQTAPCDVHVYVPPGLEEELAVPLLVLLHGTGGSGDSAHQGWHPVADHLGMVLLAPTEPGQNAGFRGDDAERGAVLAALRWLRRRIDIDEDAIFLSGNSRGGHLTWDLGLRRADIWSGILPRFGGPRFELRGRQNNFRYLEHLLGTSVWAVQAPAPEGVGWNVQEAIQRLRVFGAQDCRQEQDLPQPLDPDGAGRSWSEFAQHRREADAPRQILRAARADAGRLGWLEITAVSRTVREVFDPVISQEQFRSFDAAGLRQQVINQALARTARLEGSWNEQTGVLALTSTEVRKARVYLSAPRAQALVAEPNIRVNGKTRRVRVKPNARVLLETFVELFDRRYLPVAAIELSIR